MFTRLMDHVFKDDMLVIRPKARAPQEIEQDEVKDETQLVRDVVRETKSFESDQNAFDVAR
jgi:hypothetical protein